MLQPVHVHVRAVQVFTHACTRRAEFIAIPHTQLRLLRADLCTCYMSGTVDEVAS